MYTRYKVEDAQKEFDANQLDFKEDKIYVTSSDLQKEQYLLKENLLEKTKASLNSSHSHEFSLFFLVLF